MKVMSIDLIAIKMNGKWGFIDGFGKEIVPLRYDSIDYDSNTSDLVLVTFNKKYGCV